MVVQRPLHVYKAYAEGLPQDRPALPDDQADEDEQDGHGASAQPDGANRPPSNLHHEPPLRKEEGRGKREEGKPSLFRSGAKSAPIILPHHTRSFPIFHPSLFPLPSSLSYRLREEGRGKDGRWEMTRSEEHTSELQSQSNLVCRLLLEKKKPTSQCRARSGVARQPTLISSPARQSPRVTDDTGSLENYKLKFWTSAGLRSRLASAVGLS